MADLGYGDAGKGTVVDWLCSPAARVAGAPGRRAPHAVVRFNGGAQAAHNVVTADGRHHTFAQFGSGMFTPGVRTHLSRFVLVDPLALAAEAAHLASVGVAGPWDRLTVDRDALLDDSVPPGGQPGQGDGRGARAGTAPAAWASARPPGTHWSSRRTPRARVTAHLPGCWRASWSC